MAIDRTTAAFAEKWWDAKAETFFSNKFMGLPCLQHPFDAWVTQEIIWETKPEVIIECGSYGGGSAAMWATFMELYQSEPTVVAVDLLDRVHEARKLPVWDRCVEFIAGSSIEPATVAKVAAIAEGKRTMVILDSLHTEEHVSAELAAYSAMVSVGCYLIVQDGFINGHPCDHDAGPGPFEAIQAFLAEDDRFQVDASRERMMFTLNPSGFLLRQDLQVRKSVARS